MRHSCQKTWESTVENGRQSGVRDQVFHSGEQQTARLVVFWQNGSVTKDQSGCGFTDKQGASTIHKDSADYMVLTSSWTKARCVHHPWGQYRLYGLNLQLDNGGGSSHLCTLLDCLKRWQSDHTCNHPHRLNELATESEKWNGKPMRQLLASTFENSCGCSALDMLEWREMMKQIHWQAKQSSQVACFSDLKYWGAWDTTCRHKAMDITQLITWRREALKEEMLDDLPWKDKRAINNQMNTGSVSKATLGKLLRDGVERIWAFLSA